MRFYVCALHDHFYITFISELGPRDCDCEMSKVKERAMEEEEKKDKGEVERVKEGGGGKKKVERLPKPGSPGKFPVGTLSDVDKG